MAYRSGDGGLIGGLVWIFAIAFVISEVFKIGFWPSLGTVILISILFVFSVFTAEKILKKIKERRPCSHGIRYGKNGGCTTCSLQELQHKLEEMAANAEYERKTKIKKDAQQLQENELRVLQRKWLSRCDAYLQMNPKQFENAVAQLFRELGYEVQQTPYSNDRGRDAIALKDGKKYLIECKRYDAKNTIGRPDLQKFVAAMKEENAEGGFYINTGRFANTAPPYALQEKIELYDRVNLPKLVNRAYPVEGDITVAKVMCLECGVVEQLSVQEVRTSGTCVNGHQITNEITKASIIEASFTPSTVCEQCGSKMRLVRGKFWGCSKYPRCKFRRRYTKLAT